MSQRGSWEAARPCLLSLEATACISSSRWCLGKRGQQAAGCHREDPSCACRPAMAPCCLTGPEAHMLHGDLASVPGMGSCHLRSPGSVTSGKPSAPHPCSLSLNKRLKHGRSASFLQQNPFLGDSRNPTRHKSRLKTSFRCKQPMILDSYH